jgi:hypothetical protein
VIQAEVHQFSQIVKLIQLQSNYVEQINNSMLLLWCQLNKGTSTHFLHFVNHFSSFIHFQAGSEGYSRALELIQIYHSMFIERLLDGFVVTGAEQLELAIAHLDGVLAEPAGMLNADLAVLNQRLIVLEETELKIIEVLEQLLAQCKTDEFLN